MDLIMKVFSQQKWLPLPPIGNIKFVFVKYQMC